MAERLYAEQQGAEAGAGPEEGPAPDDNVVDAEFEEVKEDEQKDA